MEFNSQQQLEYLGKEWNNYLNNNVICNINDIKLSGPIGIIVTITLCEKCQYSEFFCSVFSRIRTEYREILSPNIQSECGKIRTRKLRIWTLFT